MNIKITLQEYNYIDKRIDASIDAIIPGWLKHPDIKEPPLKVGTTRYDLNLMNPRNDSIRSYDQALQQLIKLLRGGPPLGRSHPIPTDS